MTSTTITLNSTSQPIPSAPGVPFLGSLPEFSKDPATYLAKLANQYEGIVDINIPMLSMAVVTDAELAHEILVKHPKVFVKSKRDAGILAAFLGNGLVTNRQFNSHKTHRKIIQPGFHFRKIQSFAETMIDYVDRYTSSWKGSDTRLVSDDMFRLSMFIVSKTLFNMDMDSMEQEANDVSHHIERMQQILDDKYRSAFPIPMSIPTPANRRLKKARARMDDIIDRMIKSKTSADGQVRDDGDLLSMLLLSEYEDGQPLTRQHIMDELVTLFVAGHETTSNAMTWSLHLLSLHEEIQQKLADEIDQIVGDRQLRFEDLDQLRYTEMVIKESMRLYPPAWTLNNRQAIEDIELNGYHFPKGKVIFISPYAFHHCERYFSNAEKFDPERFNEQREKEISRYAYIPFGSGPRVCIGNSFAMMEAKVLLASIIRDFKVSPVPGQKIKPMSQVTLSNENGLCLKVARREKKR